MEPYITDILFTLCTKIPIINSMLILTLLILWPISLFTIFPSPTVQADIPHQTPHSHSFALLLHQSFDDGTIPNSMVEIGLALELLPLSPLIATRMLLNRLNRNRVLIYCITCEYSSFLFNAISCAILLWCLLASGLAPPAVEKTIGVSDPCSTFKTRSL